MSPTSEPPTPEPSRTSPARAESFVRAARGSDAPVLADLQLDCWQQEYGTRLPAGALAGVVADRDAIVERWRSSSQDPPGPRYHVLVAVESGDHVVGSVALGPVEDVDGLNPAVVAELLALQVGAEHRRLGHGSRLVTAAVDHLRADGFVGAVVWVDDADGATAELLRSGGWAPDGTTRVLDLDGDGAVVVRQARWHTDLTPEEGTP